MTRALSLLVVLCGLLIHTDAYKGFQNLIPNGDRVPHPCKEDMIWGGVGHKNMAGGGARNPFGEDFDSYGRVWSTELCLHDSDGDGKTNGEELGDPNCVWFSGEAELQATSHPGICEPLDDPQCMERNKDWEFCDVETELKCDALDEPEVQSVEIKFPPTRVPARETTYWCMTFDLPQDDDYHLIAYKPLIDNWNVMHHVLLFGCKDESNDTSWKIDSPTECGMALGACTDIIAAWTVGVNGACYPDEFGFRVGQHGYKAVTMQFHWNNPMESSDFVDGSGLELFITPKVRPNDGGIMMVGQRYINIPPHNPWVTETSTCPAACTKALEQPFNVSSVMLHMHYLGVAGSLEHHRGDELISVVTDSPYDYESPQIHNFEDFVQLRPGDELKMTCHFSSEGKDEATYYGDATSDEMCFGFLWYYPVQTQLPRCISYKSFPFCVFEESAEIDREEIMGNCDLETFYSSEIWNVVFSVEAACNNTMYPCPVGCKEAVEEAREQYDCLKGDLGFFVEVRGIARYFGDYGLNFLALWHSCDEDWEEVKGLLCEEIREKMMKEMGPNQTMRKPAAPWNKLCDYDDDDDDHHTAAAGTSVYSGLVLLMSVVLGNIL